MSKATIVTKLADELGVAAGKASRFVDDIGGDKARRLVDDLAQRGDEPARWLTNRRLAVGGAVGGGALAWRQQDVAEAQAIAREKSSYKESIKKIIESDLPPKLKEAMAADASAAARPSGNGGDGGGGGGEDNGFIGNLIGGDPMVAILMIVVIVMVFRYALEGEQ